MAEQARMCCSYSDVRLGLTMRTGEAANSTGPTNTLMRPEVA